jgi:DNA (cytosine-5)-methyltransferase 1
MKIIDLFAGVGGLSLGFEEAGFETVASVDIWEDAVATYNHNHKNGAGIVSDVHEFNRKILPKILKEHVVSGVIGGPPCQGYSSARLSDRSERILGINEERNQLYLEFVKTVKLASPDFFLLENVRGMVSLDKGAFVEDILKRFGALGYSVTFRILNASDYGVPQSRQRVFFIGIKNKEFVFPPAFKELIGCKDALSDLPLKPSSTLDYISEPKNEFQRRMRRGSALISNHEETNHSKQTIDIISLVPDGGSIKSLPEEYWQVRKFNKAFQRMNSELPSMTIDTGHRNYFHYSENRIPTVRESARIQSFPDKFEFLGSKTSQYKQVGNAVPPLLALALAREIKKQLRKR